MVAVTAKTALLSYLLSQKGATRPVRADDETVRQRLIWVRVLLLETTRAQTIIIARRKSQEFGPWMELRSMMQLKAQEHSKRTS